jgi:hypothetical protein
MVRRNVRFVLILAALIAAWSLLFVDTDRGQAVARERYTGDLFYNYYVPPCPWSGTGAQLYVAPRPAPLYVGHTYFTYQPLLPHEFLYRHHRTYWNFHADGDVTRTLVSWE